MNITWSSNNQRRKHAKSRAVLVFKLNPGRLEYVHHLWDCDFRLLRLIATKSSDEAWRHVQTRIDATTRLINWWQVPFAVYTLLAHFSAAVSQQPFMFLSTSRGCTALTGWNCSIIYSAWHLIAFISSAIPMHPLHETTEKMKFEGFR
jgi:hypothetical protein